MLITCACRELPGGGWRLTGPTDSLPSVVGSPDKARQRRLRGTARNFVSADKPVKHPIGIFLNIFI
ncbi:hypothetical protein MJN51_26760, partial [Salmonella enterica subsp. enterica serovar Kentucky]|nr:hypothetical protein [Salmonella enterica subsp. enterica serovar Kentucky]